MEDSKPAAWAPHIPPMDDDHDWLTGAGADHDLPDGTSCAAARQVHAMYLRQQALRWIPGDIKCATEAEDTRRADPAVRHALTLVMAFFAFTDGQAMDNAAGLSQAFRPFYVRAFYADQAAMEAVHSITYKDVTDAMFPDEGERRRLRTEVQRLPALAAKRAWVQRWLSAEAPVGERLAAWALVEGVFFASSFALIAGIKQRLGGAFAGVAQSNEMIMRDEMLHVEFGCLLHRLLPPARRCPAPRAAQMAEEALAAELGFVAAALAAPAAGVTAEALAEHVRWSARRVLHAAGLGPETGPSPLAYMRTHVMEVKANFFEVQPTAYATPSGTGLPDELPMGEVGAWDDMGA